MSARLPAVFALVAVALGAAPSTAPAQEPPLLAPGRVADLDGELLLLPAGWDDWRPAERNSAVAPGDWLRTGRADSALLELAPSVLVRLGPWTELRVDRQEDVLVLELLQGRLTACSSFGAEGLSVVTRDGTAWLEPGGFYGLEVEGGLTVVAVSSGLAEVESAGAGSPRRVSPGRLAELDRGSRKPKLRRLSGRGWDSFDREAHETCRRELGDDADLRLVGASTLSRHGEWVVIGGSRYWRPLGVSSGWRPYGDGCFRWHPSWGWYFVPHAPWGWVTHHHGGWSWFADWGWVWYPDSWWHPHRVTFVVRERTVYWCPRPVRSHPHRDHRHDGHPHHDDRWSHDRTGPAGGPGAGWSQAPLDEFGVRPVVRARAPLPGVELPRLMPLDEDRRGLGGPPPERELLRPPLPPRAREPLLGPTQPLAPRPELRRELPRPEQPDAPDASDAATDRLERPGRGRPVGPVAVRPAVPGLRERAPRLPDSIAEPSDRPGRSAPGLPESARPLGAPGTRAEPGDLRPADDRERAGRPGLRERGEPRGTGAPPAIRERPELPSPRVRPSPGVLRDRERELERRRPAIETPRPTPAPERPAPGIREAPRPTPAPERPAPEIRELPRPAPPPAPEVRQPEPAPRVRERPAPSPQVRETPPAPTPTPAPRVRRSERPAPSPAPQPERPAPRRRGDDDDDKR